jgi:hypothetical protein
MRVDPVKAAAWQALWLARYRPRWQRSGGKLHPISAPSRPAQNESGMGNPASASVIRALEDQINSRPESGH